MSKRKLEAVLGLSDQTKAGLKSFENNVDRMSNKVFDLGKKAAIGLVGVATGAAVIGSAFEQGMANVAAVTGATEDEMSRLTAEAKRMGATSIFSANEASDAIYALSSAGFNADQSIASLSGVMSLAAAEGADLELAAEAVTAALAIFGEEAEESARVANLYAAGVSAGLQKLPDMQEAMKNAAPAAAALNLSMEQTVALVTEFANQGQKGGIGGSRLAQGLRALTKPAGQVKEILGDLNLTNTDLITLLKKLEQAGYQGKNALADLGEAGFGLNVLLNSGTTAIEEMTASITGTNRAQEKMDRMLDTLRGDLKLMRSGLEGVAIEMYEAFGPELRKMVQDVTESIGEFGDYIIDNKDNIAEGAKEAYEALTESVKWLYEHREGIKNTIIILFGAATVSKVHSMAKAMKTLTTSGALSFIGRLGPMGWLAAGGITATWLAIKEFDHIVKEQGDGRQKLLDAFSGPPTPAGLTDIVITITPEMNPDFDWAQIMADQEAAAASSAPNEWEMFQARLLTAEDYLGQRAELFAAADFGLTAMVEAGMEQRTASEVANWQKSFDNTAAFVSSIAAIREQAQIQALESYGMFWDNMEVTLMSATIAMANSQMDANEKWLAVRDTMFKTALKQVTGWVFNTMKQYWLEMVGKKAVEKSLLKFTIAAEASKTTAKGVGVQARIGLNRLENAATGVSTNINKANMAAEVTAFYAPMGPLGVPLAAATIAEYLALIAGAKYLSGGGRVGGSGGDRSDNQMAFLSPDEYVIQAPTARAIGYGNLDAMNAGRGAGGGATMIQPVLQIHAPEDAGQRIRDIVQDYLESTLGQDMIEELFRHMVIQGRYEGVI